MALACVRAAAVTSHKRLHFVRHGQAVHNVRAEKLREDGCSYQEFLDQMAADDAFDAPLTEVGLSQAAEASGTVQDPALLGQIQLVVASPLSRALDTADVILPPTSGARRMALDDLREVSGLLLNAKRRSRRELEERYTSWDFSSLTEDDDLWSQHLEPREACAERGYRALQEIWRAEEANVLVVAHGGLFSFLFDLHPQVDADDRIRARFRNCEVRRATFRAVPGSVPIAFKLEGVAEGSCGGAPQ
eukprot:TRINITY_DN48944_c0_g1_i1.p1 TRINITY_DN48944_c0_g1~~TRINITY_DN48944_c0_g1_i1.p1  ORF type:complete len:247 (-),score=34.55 TRINITY_DN48944_c0_g1_i1:66-806(-)